jgi:hypothetical protein
MACRTGLSPTVTARLNSIGRSVVRAWVQPAVDRGEIGKAIYKIGRCLEVEGTESPEHGDAALFPDLQKLSLLLESLLTPSATAPETEAPAAAPIAATESPERR